MRVQRRGSRESLTEFRFINRAWIGLGQALEGSIENKILGLSLKLSNICKIDDAIDLLIPRGSYEPKEEVGDLDEIIALVFVLCCHVY
ncbi:hypothetical protein MKW98_023857 [Papaver atlanticum]|uniref:Uncharacterized protein n=1 Tax=Papaver atlanticum TaxID=357466 RepID=A0AAD4SZ47_9MAGN|nr:hypothetical protein MKW98_023857 [Papaver atlanticum]